MKVIGHFRCSHKEISSEPDNIVYIFRASEPDYGGNLIIRMKAPIGTYELGKLYPIGIGDAILEKRKDSR